MRIFRNFSIAIIITIFSGAAVFAGDIVDQQQLVTAASTTSAIGGSSEQELAQSFTVGVDGFLTQIRLPVGCSSGELIVEIQRLNADGEPNGVVVTSARVAAEDLSGPIEEFKTIYLSPRIPVRRGDRFAVVLKNPTGTCGVLHGPEADTYGGGKYFYDSRPNPPGWVGDKDRPAPLGTPGDLAFQTVVDDGGRGGSSNMCFGDLGLGSMRRIPLPISADVPLCGCLSNALLNNWRCRLLHPDFFMIVRIQFPPNPPGPINERWSFMPLTKLDGPVKMSYEGKDGTMIHEFGKRSKVGSFEYFNIRRSGGAMTFSYPMKNAVSPFQQLFGFEAPFPGIKELTKVRKTAKRKTP